MGTSSARQQQRRNHKTEQFGNNPHTVKTHAKYQEGGIKDKNGFRNFPLSSSQKDCMDVIKNNVITFVEGPAGSGKSLCALYYAAENYLKNPAESIIIIRTPVESGSDKVGYLPNDLKSKLEPHFSSTKIILENLLTPEKVQSDLEGNYKRIKFLIPNFALGATYDNCTIIIDEAQMLQPLIMKLLLERTGVNSKVIILGDSTQVYARDTQRNGMLNAMSKFFELASKTPLFEDIGYFKFNVDDCMRSDIVKTVLHAYKDGV